MSVVDLPHDPREEVRRNGWPAWEIAQWPAREITLSSARYKKDIAAMGARSAGVHRLRPVTFAYHKDAPGTIQYGLVAEDVAAVYPELVTHTATGEVQTVKYHELIPMLLNELQREHHELAMLRKELAELRALMGSRLER
jgi:hypothetical protein